MEAVIEGGGVVKSMMECSKVVEQARREGIGSLGSALPIELGVKNAK